MATDTEVLSHALAEVANRLTGRGLSGGQVEPDRVVVALDEGDTTQAWITAMGSSQMLSVQVRSARRLPRDSWPTVLREVNAHNRDHRLTSSWLLVDNWETSTAGSIVIEAALPVTAEHTVGQIVDFVDLVLADGSRFWNTDLPAPAPS